MQVPPSEPTNSVQCPIETGGNDDTRTVRESRADRESLRDRCWLWGQNVGSHHGRFNPYKLPGINRMDPVEGGRFFGIPNCCRVAMPSGPEPPFDAETAALQEFRQVVWSAIGSAGVKRHDGDASDLEEVLRQAERFPNVSGAILDDFFTTPELLHTDAPTARHSLASIAAMRDQLHRFAKRKLDLWMVLYTFQMQLPVQAYLDLCDVITLWTWNGSDLDGLDDHLAECVARTPGKRHLAGCYLWNYGETRPLTRKQMAHQLEVYDRWLASGKLEGVVVCSNCTADLGLETVPMLLDWLNRGPRSDAT